MSLRRAVVATYASQAYVTLIGLLLVPVYLRVMGAENYGLVGIFLMLQGWFQLLDVGMTPTISRESARYNSGVGKGEDLVQLVSALQAIFVVVAVVTSLLFLFASAPIARGWLTFGELTELQVTHALQLIGVLVSLRWVSGLFRGVIAGFERMLWLASFNAVVATLRFVLVVPILVYVDGSAATFFIYQVAVAAIEAGVLVWTASRLLPSRPDWIPGREAWNRLSQLSGFALTIAFTGALSIIVTGFDKLILSRVLSLEAYGYFTASILLAGGIAILASPVAMVLQPRLANLAATEADDRLLAVYHGATQTVASVVVPAALVLAAFSHEILWVWSGDPAFASASATTLAAYAVGNAVMTLGALPFQLQYAKGVLRLHLVGSVLFVCAFVPLCTAAAFAYGPVGTGAALIAVASVYLLLWVPRIHSSFGTGLHSRWLLGDLLPVAVSAGVAVLVLRQVISGPDSRALMAAQLAAVSIVSVVAAVMGSSHGRQMLTRRVRRMFEPGRP